MPTQPLSPKTRRANHIAADQSAALTDTSLLRAEDGHGGSGRNSGQLLRALFAARNGDFSVRLPADWIGVDGKIADAFNDIMVANETMARELERVSRVVGKEGKIGQRASFSSNGRAWRRMEESVNTLVSDLVWPISEITRTIGAVAKGDLTQVMSLEVDGRQLQGEFTRSPKICNTMHR